MFDSFFSGDGFISIFFLLFIVAFVAILGMILVTFVRELSQRNRNNHSPRLTVEATVVAKRQSFSSHRSGGEMHTTTSTRYFATFQVESGRPHGAADERPGLRYAGGGGPGPPDLPGDSVSGFSADVI